MRELQDMPQDEKNVKRMNNLQEESDKLKSQIEARRSEINDLETKLKEVENEKNNFQQQNEGLENDSEKEKEEKERPEADLSNLREEANVESSKLKDETVKQKNRPGRKCFVLFMNISTP